ncbi:nucleotide exchange factor GrpE [Jeotgalicoccus huakuii]|uniref:nucleotide exchange factor GrpE n=1 Tax=unclassified Jeotgalicoccus TaxID=2630462 RepID=UPI001414CF98|nr:MULTISPECIES: nucleotide exchange factor GrpE [unclassified Jeotgalicoccus]MCK1977503.1 nucleotide exchange factor GrpE [Jeotgalicoccus huakuii]QQD85520.1 nucleotide exchange factor GrpE [Jeotgalicoccus sp. ATCC 8456]
MTEEKKDVTSEELDTETVDSAKEESVEVSTETDDNTTEAVSNESEEEKQENVIAELKNEVEATENKYLKLYAEFENYKRRTRQEAEINNKYKDQKFAENLLPVIDNLERALSIEGDTESFEALNKGVEMVYNNLLDTLKNHDIKAIEALDQPFDPNFHQAVMTEAVEGKDAGLVVEEFQKGYILKDRVIRPTMVKVSE